MANNQNNMQNAFGGMSREQIAKIVYDELSKSGFQFNNVNNMIPSIINRIITENGSMVGSYFAEMLLRGMMGGLFKK